MQFVGSFAAAVADEARRRGVDGVVCGHIHMAEIREIDGVLYCNDGDWVESCTALVEHFDGQLEVVHWIELRSLDPLNPREPVDAIPIVTEAPLGLAARRDCSRRAIPFITAYCARYAELG